MKIRIGAAPVGDDFARGGDSSKVQSRRRTWEAEKFQRVVVAAKAYGALGDQDDHVGAGRHGERKDLPAVPSGVAEVIHAWCVGVHGTEVGRDVQSTQG